MCVYDNGRGGQVWVRRPRGSTIAEKAEFCWKRAHHGKKVNVFGFITSKGVGEMEVFEENMTGLICKRLMNKTLLNTAKSFFNKNESWWLLHDNDKKFTSGEVQQWLFNHGVQVMDWPPYSPDLNPIEHIWAYIKRRVAELSPKGVDELTKAIKK